ncbi:MAG TPA: histidine phosphatase family protein [Sporichthyaceae bacterium]|nr:histidine phosphatase family protein [Sporichthyaceae bacterium]
MSESEGVYPQYRFRIPAGACDLLLVRHGESAAMPAGSGFPTTPSGQADPELSPAGCEQAVLVSARLAKVGLDALYASSLRRTQQTIAPLVEQTGMKPTIDPDLREIELGEWEGGEFRRLANIKDPRMMRLLRNGSWSQVPGGEDSAVFAGRVQAAITRIAAAHPDQRVAVVCHGGVIGQIIALATGASTLSFMGSDNSSISQVIVHDGHWIVRRFNDTEHLSPAFTTAAAPPE